MIYGLPSWYGEGDIQIRDGDVFTENDIEILYSEDRREYRSTICTPQAKNRALEERVITLEKGVQTILSMLETLCYGEGTPSKENGGKK